MVEATSLLPVQRARDCPHREIERRRMKCEKQVNHQKYRMSKEMYTTRQGLVDRMTSPKTVDACQSGWNIYHQEDWPPGPLGFP